VKQHPPGKFPKKLVNKIAIKTKIGGHHWQFFLKAFSPPQGFWQKLPPWI